MSIGGHTVWAVLLIVGGVAFGLAPVEGCGSAWTNNDTAGQCVSAVSSGSTGSALVLIVALFTVIGLVGRLFKTTQAA